MGIPEHIFAQRTTFRRRVAAHSPCQRARHPGFHVQQQRYPDCQPRPITVTNTTWSFPLAAWKMNTKLVIFSACRQLAGRPQQFRWSQRMRGASL
jgi:hypothetical protein